MKTPCIGLLAAVLLAGCTGPEAWRADTAQMPLNAEGGPAMNQTQAIELASSALQDPASTRGNPGRAARAIAAEDWLAGQDMLTGNLGTYAPVDAVPWGLLRGEARAAIGVRPDARSQVVVEHLLAAADALEAGRTDAATAKLTDPAFTLGPQGTLAALASLPMLPDSGWAFTQLGRNADRSVGTGCPSGC
jgi:hypothetical protein